MRTRREVAVFVTRLGGAEILILLRSARQGGYWHVVAGGVERGETVTAAAERELSEETGLFATVADGVEVIEHVSLLTGEPAESPNPNDPSLAHVHVTCFRVTAPAVWEPKLDWEHDDHRWCDVGEAFRTLRWPGTAQALRSLFPDAAS